MRSRNVIAGLVEAGHEIEILCYPFGRELDLPNTHISRIPRVPGIRRVKVGPSFAKIPLDILMMFKAWFLCMRNRYDVIEAVEEAAFIASPLSRMFRRGFVYHMDSHLSDHVKYSGFIKNRWILGMIEKMERRAMRAADLVITVNEYLTDEVKSHAPDTPVLQLEDAPLNEDFIAQPEEAEALRKRYGLGDAPVVLYIGNFGKYQGLDLLIESAAHVAKERPEARFVLVGGAEHEVEYCKGVATRHGVLDRCVFPGIRPTREMPAFMTMAKVLTSPRAQGTNTPLKIYDYMQSGRPIVATDLETHRQVLDEQCAYLVPLTPEGIAQGILDALNHPEEASRRVAKAVERVLKHYSLPIFKDKVKTAFGELEERLKPAAG